MIELTRTNNPVLISYIEALLRGEGVGVFVMDMNASILDGSVGILPRRVMVADEDYSRARFLMHQAELADELYSHD